MPTDPRLLVGLDTGDDAGVFALDAERALVQTVDFFTPVVDDPYLFGQVAAANALSDIYAMGARPLTALNLVAYPTDTLDLAILREILRGGLDKVREAGAVLVGGHSIQDAEPKFGLAVTGLVHPGQTWTNAGARPGDAVVLTKPIGTGIIAKAVKEDAAEPEWARLAGEAMATLNRAAAEAAKAVGGPHACTDVTGFGLLGHARTVARASRVALRLWAQRVPVLPGTRVLAERGLVPAGSRSNLEFVASSVRFAPDIDPVTRLILADAVTSGGLLLAMDPAAREPLLAELSRRGVAAAVIGEVLEGPPGTLEVV